LHMGYLDEYFCFYANEHAKPSLLSLADVEDLYNVIYVPGQAFIVHSPGGVFNSKEVTSYKLYRADYNNVKAPLYIRHMPQYKRMKVCTLTLRYVEQRKTMSFSSEVGIPHWTKQGKLTKKVIAYGVIDPTVILREKAQVLCTDVMHVDGHKFLIQW